MRWCRRHRWLTPRPGWHRRTDYGITLITPMLADTSPQARSGAGFDRTAFAIDFDKLTLEAKQSVSMVTVEVHPLRRWSRCGGSSGARAGGGVGEGGGIPDGAPGEVRVALARLTAVVVPVSRRACSSTSR